MATILSRLQCVKYNSDEYVDNPSRAPTCSNVTEYEPKIIDTQHHKIRAKFRPRDLRRVLSLEGWQMKCTEPFTAS